MIELILGAVIVFWSGYQTAENRYLKKELGIAVASPLDDFESKFKCHKKKR